MSTLDDFGKKEELVFGREGDKRQRMIPEVPGIPAIPRKWSYRTLALGVVITLITLELGSAIAYGALTGEMFSYRQSSSRRAEIAVSLDEESDVFADNTNGNMSHFVVHPYLGYMRNFGDPNVVEGQEYLLGYDPLITAPNPNSVVVGIFGGSFAEQFADLGSGPLKDLLQKNPKFAGKNIEIVTAALAGYKQPQQLMAFNYLLSLGQHFDVVINIDGFNEIAGPTLANVHQGVSPFHPSGWYHLAERLPETEVLTAIGQIAEAKQDRVELAESFSGPISGRSIFAQFLWEGMDRRQLQHIADLQLALNQTPPADVAERHLLGMPYDLESEEKLIADLVASWKRSSQLMYSLSESRGIEYVHVLQPNQYLAGTKTLTDEEKSVAFNEHSPYRSWVERGYPALQVAGEELRQQGVTFVDGTGVFATVSETVYKDDCCHINAVGNAKLATLLVQQLQQPTAARQ